MSDNELTEIYEQLLAISQRALASQHYEAAFHALSAALHCAEELKDEQRLSMVKQEAEHQKNFIDTHSPHHRMSTQTAAQRNGVNLYNALIGQARVHIKQFSYERHQAERRHIIESDRFS